MNALLMAVMVTAAPVKAGPVSAHATINPGAQSWAGQAQWSDGQKQRTVFESAVLVAEVKPSDEGKAAVLQADASAALVQKWPTIRVWQVRDARAVRQAVPSLQAVYFDAATSAARSRVAVGNVNVFVKKSLTTEQRSALQKELNATVKDSGLWSVPCPGSEALALAATLSKRSEIELATPNWWTAAHRR